MKRYIEIQDDQNELKQFSMDDLPFEIYILYDEKSAENLSSSNEKYSLSISKVDEYDLDVKNKTIENHKKIICAYIAQDEGYLFFQSSTEKINNNEIKLFHNDEIIEESVWLKSGDILQIASKIITYTVSGDMIQIHVSDKSLLKLEPKIISPPLFYNNSDKKNIEKLPEVSSQTELSLSDNKKIKKRALIGFTIVLIIMACFILFAETVSISIEPEADKIELTGILPVLKIRQRYILLNGKYDLSAYKSGYITLNKTLDIDSKNNEFSFVIQEKPGIILFNITPDKNNKIYVDDILLGKNIIKEIDEEQTKTTINNIQYEIDKGQHNIIVVNPRYKKFEQLILVEGKNKLQKFDFKLEPNWGYVKISSETENAAIKIYSDLDDEEPVLFIQGTNKEINNATDIELIAGHYTVKLSKEKYKDKTESFSIKAGDRKNIEITELEAEDALINLTSNPLGSLIRIDGQYMGKTPQSIKLSPYIEHEIELSLSGYKEIKKNIKLEPDEVSEQNYRLETIKGIVFITVTPAQAKLFIDGKKQKESSGKFNLGGNNHTIKATAKGYETQTKKINATSYSKNISFNLKKINTGKYITQVSSQQTKKIYVKNKNYSNYKNKIRQKMILIKPAVFVMGSKKNEAGRGSNEREYEVKLDYSYYLSEQEISNKQFRQFKPAHNSGITSGVSLNTDKQPVVNVSWNEAAKFTNWLSKKEGLNVYYKEVNGQMMPIDLSGKINGYRLPFEAEWAFAARGKNQKKYPWSGNFPPKSVSGNFSDESAKSYVSNIIEGYNDQYSVSAPVGSYAKNAAGFYDLGGNVSEWCQDYYAPYSGLSGNGLSGNAFSGNGSSGNKIAINPTGPKKGTHKVVRDSSWRDASMTELRLSYRNYNKNKARDIGFRIARYAQ